MVYRVDISPAALNDIEQAFRSLARTSAETAYAWYGGMMAAIYSLELFPERCPIILEDAELKIGVRKHTYGRRRFTYHILFHIRDGDDPDILEVRVIRVRHASRDDMRKADIEKGTDG